MRRHDRDVTGPEAIEAIFARCRVCRLALADDDAPYIVPVNFGYERAGDTWILYGHGAPEGRKMERMRRRPRVGFEMDTGHGLREADEACAHGFGYESVVGTGYASILEAPADKARGLGLLMAHLTGRGGWTFREEALRRTAVFAVRVDACTAKRHAPAPPA